MPDLDDKTAHSTAPQETKPTHAEALRTALSPPVARRSLWVAVIVGTVLNAINQGDLIYAGENPDWLKLGLTYCVPFCVATYGAYSAASMVLGRK